MTTPIALRLTQAESLQAALLAEINACDAQLSTMQPADPARAVVIARKAELLPRYRGAKENVKHLRRVANMTSPAVAAGFVTASAPIPPIEPVVETPKVERESLRPLYETLVGLIDRHHTRPNRARAPLLEPEELRVLSSFVESFETSDGAAS